MKKLFWLNTCRVDTTKNIINTNMTIELKLFVFKSLLMINNKTTMQVTFPLLLMVTLDKKPSFIQHLCFSRSNEVIKISIMTLIIKGHGNCKTNWFLKFRKSRIKILVIANFIKNNWTLRFAHKRKTIWNIQKQKRIKKNKVLQIRKLNAQTSIQL